MDGGPFRAPRSAETDRRVISRQEPAPRQPIDPQPIAEEPKKYRQSPNYQAAEEKKPFKRRFIVPLVALVVLLLLAGGWFVLSSKQNAAIGIDGGKYQAVFFTNGQVYFGKLSGSNNSYLKLTDIYYLQTESTDGSNSVQAASTDQSNNAKLVKLGDEIHGPEDEMIISKDQVLFYENLKADGKVAQAIQKAKN